MSAEDRKKVTDSYSAAAVQMQQCGGLLRNLDSGEDFKAVVQVAKRAATVVDKLHGVLSEMNLKVEIEQRQEELEEARDRLAELERRLSSMSRPSRVKPVRK